MLPLASFLLLLKEMEDQTVERAKSPPNRDAFELGMISGMFAVIASMQERINELVEQHNRTESDE